MCEADHRIAVDLDAHQLGGDPVLRQCPHGAAGSAVLHVEDEGGDEYEGEYANDDTVIRHDDAALVEHAFDDLGDAALLLTEQQQDDGVEKEGRRRCQ